MLYYPQAASAGGPGPGSRPGSTAGGGTASRPTRSEPTERLPIAVGDHGL